MAPSDPQIRPNLLSLPPEIRCEIYSQLVGGSHNVYLLWSQITEIVNPHTFQWTTHRQWPPYWQLYVTETVPEVEAATLADATRPVPGKGHVSLTDSKTFQTLLWLLQGWRREELNLSKQVKIRSRKFDEVFEQALPSQKRIVNRRSELRHIHPTRLNFGSGGYPEIPGLVPFDAADNLARTCSLVSRELRDWFFKFCTIFFEDTWMGDLWIRASIQPVKICPSLCRLELGMSHFGDLNELAADILQLPNLRYLKLHLHHYLDAEKRVRSFIHDDERQRILQMQSVFIAALVRIISLAPSLVEIKVLLYEPHQVQHLGFDTIREEVGAQLAQSKTDKNVDFAILVPGP